VIWIVIGDLKKVEAGIRALALGEIVRIDADGNPVGLVPAPAPAQ
jgi:zinc protease